MKEFASVFAREVREKWLLPVAALGAGIIALAAPILPAARLHSPDDVRAGAASVFALAFGLGAALMLGGSVLSSDLFERRLGFYLARPLSPFTIWAGKIAAAIGLAASSALLALLPSALTGASLREAALGAVTSRQAPVLVAAALLLVPLAHVGAVILRSRSPLLVADVAAVGTAALVARQADREFFREGAVGVLLMSVILLAAGLAAGILSAGPAQIAAGRTDLRRGRLALSLALWIGIALGAVGALAWSAWVRSAGPEDVAVRSATPAPRGDWTVVEGPTPRRAGYSPTFLVNVAAGTGHRVPAYPVFSGDGRRAAWLHAEEPRQPARARLVLAELGPRGVSERRTSVFAHESSGLVLDSDGTRIAVVWDRLLAVYDAEGRQLLALRRPDIGWGAKATFRSADLLRLWTSPNWDAPARPLEVLDIDLEEKSVSTVGRSEPIESKPPLLADGAGERILVRRKDEAIELRDGRTASRLAALGATRGEALSPDFLPDGRVVTARAVAGGLLLRVHSRDGVLLFEIPLGRGRSVSIGGTPEPGVLVVTVSDDESLSRNAATRVIAVDLEARALRPLAEGLYPAGRFARWVDRDPTRGNGPEGLGARLFFGPGGSLVKLDPLSGRRHTVLPGHSDPFAP